MFVIDPSPEFDAEVHLTEPGTGARKTLHLRFRHKGRRELAAWRQQSDGRDAAEVLAEVIVGWSNVRDTDGNEVPFSSDKLQRLLDAYLRAPQEIYEGYLDALLRAQQGN